MLKSKVWGGEGRPYGAGYQAPSTALYSTEKASLFIGRTSEPLFLSCDTALPDFIEVVAEICVIPKRRQPIVQVCDFQREVYGQDLRDYFHESLYLKAEGRIRWGGENSLIGKHPELILPEDGYLYEHAFDHVEEDVFIPEGEEGPLLALGCFYRLGCDLGEIRQSLISFYLQGEEIRHDLSHLEVWWKRGVYPPDQVTADFHISNTRVNETYLPLNVALKEGGAMLHYRLGIDSEGEEICQVYRSVDVVVHGRSQVIITYQKGEMK